MIRILFLIAGLFAGAAFAQTNDTPTPPPPPPLIDAPPPPSDAPKKDDAPKVDEAPTPPPPGAHLPGSQGQTGYQYSPYGQPQTPPKDPPPEYGLIITEFLFGALTAAPIVLLPYVLFIGPTVRATRQLDQLTQILFLVIFASVPIAIAQTEIGIANGSKYYEVEGWPAYLSGLVTQAAVIGLYYLIGPAVPIAETVLLVGSILAVPAVETAALNLTKTPRGYGGFGMVNHAPGRGWSFSKPQFVPIFSRTVDGLRVGVSVPLFGGAF